MTAPLDREAGAPGHGPSVYAATAKGDRPRPRLEGTVRADVCVVGGGFTGLSAALHLAEAGRSVVLLEANRLGWGASGRNGGQLHSGQRRDQHWLEDHLGGGDARLLWNLAEEAKALVRDLVARHAIDCELADGLYSVGHTARHAREEMEYADKLARDYGYGLVEPIGREALAAAIGTDRYFGGNLDRGAAHLHPLNFALGMAAAAERAGARLFELSRAVTVTPGAVGVVETAAGRVEAAEIVLAGNGYLAGIAPDLEARVLPIRNYILATEPLGERARAVIPGGEGVSDSRFVVRYWRIDASGRMLFGGGETFGLRDPRDVKAFVRSHMLEVYPGLADVAVDYAWGGTLGITVTRVPVVGRQSRGLYAAGGYSGQGVGLAVLAGKAIAEGIVGDTGRLDVFGKLPTPRFPGGRTFRAPLLALAMTWFSLRDRM